MNGQELKFEIHDRRGKHVFTVKPGYDDIRSEIYIPGEEDPVMTCRFVPIQISSEDLPKLKNIESINDVIDQLDLSNEGEPPTRIYPDTQYTEVSSELDFFVNCSNLQAWVEHDYDTRLLDYRLSFPLLRELAWNGDKYAHLKLKEEIAKRYRSGTEQLRRYFEKGDFLERYKIIGLNDEFWDLYFALLEPEEQIAMNITKETVDWLDCGIKDGHVTSLVLGKPHALSTELAQLKYLEELVILKGTIEELPEWLGRRSSLKTLKLIEAPFKTLSRKFGHCTPLEELHLLALAAFEGFSPDIGPFPCLRVLAIDECDKLITLPREIARFSALINLQIKECKNLSAIPKEFGDCPSLEKLKIIDCSSLEALPDEIGNLKKLKELTIKDCGLRSLPEGIGNLRKIERIKIENCPLKELPEGIGNLKNLIHLEITNCLLEELPESIGNLINLNYLDLENNHLKIFPQTLSNLTNLGLLFLDGNHWNQVPEHVFSIPNLRALSLNGCGLKSLPESIYKLTQLRDLELNRNEIEEIPSEIMNLVNLKKLGLANNKIKEFNDELCNLPKLTYLSLIRNPLSSLPECIYKKEMILYIDDTNITFTENKASEIRKKVRSLGINSSQIDWGK